MCDFHHPEPLTFNPHRQQRFNALDIMNATDEQINAWLKRHGLELNLSTLTDARCAFEDAQTLIEIPIMQTQLDEAAVLIKKIARYEHFEEEDTCQVCGDQFDLRDCCESTAFCDPCAQKTIVEIIKLAKSIAVPQPEKETASETAARESRVLCSKLSRAEKDGLYRRGMEIINWPKPERFAKDIPLPAIPGAPLIRQDIIDGLREAYQGMLDRDRRKDPTLTGYPDMVTILNHIEIHGLPPKS